MQWTIDAAKESQNIDRIIVSTDDPEVAQIARENDCTVIDRPEHLAHDTATIDSAARHAYDAIGSPDQPIVILYANVPVRPEWLIDEAVNLLAKSGCDSVQSYARVGKHHPWWTVKLDEQGSVAPWEGDTLYHNCFRRQDLPAACVPDGGVIALTPEALMCKLGAPDGPHAFLGNDRRGIQTVEGDVIDIDSRNRPARRRRDPERKSGSCASVIARSGSTIRPYIIAEIGVNHDGDVERALELTAAAADAERRCDQAPVLRDRSLDEQSRETRRVSKKCRRNRSDRDAPQTRAHHRRDGTQVVERAHSKNIHAIVTVFSTESGPDRRDAFLGCVQNREPGYCEHAVA